MSDRAEVGFNLLASVASGILTQLGMAAVKSSGSAIAEPVQKEGNAKMSYDLVGEDLFDDDDIGAIGAEEEELLAELVSGMGDSEIIGYDDDEIEGVGLDEDLLVGAARRSRQRRKARGAGRRKQALRKLAMRNAAGVVKTGLDKRRRYPLGFVPTNITAGSTSSIPSSPQNLYRAERLVIPSDICFDLGITDIKVGNQSQFVQNVEVPAAIFSEVAIDTAVHFDTAEVGNQVSVSARNKSAVTVEFTAALIGTAAK
jgi:hypothetical protein